MKAPGKFLSAGSKPMDTTTAKRAIERRLRFGDAKQIEAFDYLERLAELKELLLAYLLEGDESQAHLDALREALGNHWPALLARMQGQELPVDAAAQ
jgi:hypothetical protein